MAGLPGVQKVGGGPRGGQGGGDLLADQARFPDTGHAEASGRGLDRVDGLQERRPKVVDLPPNGVRLDLQNLSGCLEIQPVSYRGDVRPRTACRSGESWGATSSSGCGSLSLSRLSARDRAGSGCSGVELAAHQRRMTPREQEEAMRVFRDDFVRSSLHRLADMETLVDRLEKAPADLESVRALLGHFHGLSGAGGPTGFRA